MCETLSQLISQSLLGSFYLSRQGSLVDGFQILYISMIDVSVDILYQDSFIRLQANH